MWDRFFDTWEKYMIRPIDQAMIPISSVIGENDLGQNAYMSRAETKIEKLNYVTFLHSHEHGQDSIFRDRIRFRGYNASVYSLSLGFEGHYQQKDTLRWLDETLNLHQDEFKIAYYHYPLFPACGDHQFFKVELETRTNATDIFKRYNLKLAFEHNEQLYKVSYPMSQLQKADNSENSTVYLGGGFWSALNAT